MRVDDAPGPSGRARAVEDQASGIAVDRGLGELGLGGLPRLGVEHQGAEPRQFGPHGVDDRVHVPAGHHDPRAAIPEEIPQLVGREPRVQGERDALPRRASPGGPPGTAASPGSRSRPGPRA